MERDDPLSPGGGTPSGPPTFTGVPPQRVEVSGDNGVGDDGVPPQVDDNSMSGTPLSSTSFGAAARNGRLFEDQSPIQSAWSDDETVHRRSRQRRSQRQQRPQVVQIAPDDLRDAIASGISRSLVLETLNVSRMQRPDCAR